MLIRARDAVHVGLFASTGAGKGVSYLIPNMLALRGGAVVLDPQGSIYETTAKHLKKKGTASSASIVPASAGRAATG